MSQNRQPPAYMEYAANLMAQLPFRTMPLEARGLLFTMKLECWVNARLPSNENDLAKVLGVTVAEVSNSINAVMPFFMTVGQFIICPELEDYRAHLAERRAKQSKGGKIGSAITNKKIHNTENSARHSNSSSQSSTSRLTRQDGHVSLVQHSTEKQNQNPSIGKGLDPFVIEYEAAENCSPNEYAIASAGRITNRKLAQS